MAEIDQPNRETWRSNIAGYVVVRKYDRRGDPFDEQIAGGSKFQISPEERLYNQDLAASADLDPFRNGMLHPVRLLDGTEDKAEIASNPNLLSESDMESLFAAHPKTFQAKINSISNNTTLDRLLKVASEVDATLKQVAVIQARKAELSPVQLVERETILPNVKTTADLRPTAPA